MNRILLTILASVAFSSSITPEAFGALASPDEQTAHQHDHVHHDKSGPEKTAAEMAKECEERLEKIKNAGASLPADLKADFDYTLKLAGVEIEALKDVNLKNHKKHAIFCHRHLRDADQIIKRHEHQLAREKKAEERKAKMEERKLRAEERKAKAEERKAKREAEKAAAHHDKDPNKDKVKDDGLDHGRSEGSDKTAPGSEAAKPAIEEKK